jgi:predicted Rossmann fold nucleotide-binding protein DprA/Smf involved in DNA uptake
LTSREKGFLLLTSHLGDPSRKPLTVAQLRNLASRARELDITDPNRHMIGQDLTQLGYAPEMAERILALLSDKELLEYYLHRGNRLGCQVLTRVSEGYPMQVRTKLGLDSPGCLWMKGDISLLERPSVSSVGSRDLRKANREFAYEVGTQAAKQGYVLVSGNARGTDTVSQEACLAAGGYVISVVADRLEKQPERERVLYISEDSFDAGFSAQRAISRNRVIHTLSSKTFVSQCTEDSGGTWDGTIKNLKAGFSSVYCFRDGSIASQRLADLGAMPIGMQQLSDFSQLQQSQVRMEELL